MQIYLLALLAMCLSTQHIYTEPVEDIDLEEESIPDTPAKSINFEPDEFVTPETPSNAYFAQFFPNPSLPSSWIVSKAKKDDSDDEIAKYNGEWSVSSPDQIVLKNDYCLIVMSKARHHAISSQLDKAFKFNAGKPFIVQYEVKFQNGLECGGAYIKLLTGNSLNLNDFNDKTPYSIMFGPDKCGTQSKLHFIIQFKNPKSQTIQEHHAKQPSSSLDNYFSTDKSHLFTLLINTDDTYKIWADEKEVMSGDLKSTLSPAIIPDKEIFDPNDKKPEDWDEREKIPDSNAKKPEDWDENAPEKIEDVDAQKPSDWLEDEAEFVSDEKAEKPTDWDEEMDGKYEAPLVKNPKCEKASGCGTWKRPMIPNKAYKGKWQAPLIDNPKYQGKWEARKIENPAFFDIDSPFAALQPINAIGIELWTMNDGIAFDNFLITDEKSIADHIAEIAWKVKSAAEERKSGKSSIITTLIEAANDKPWLWAVYLLVILIPIVLITIFCFSGSKKDQSAEAKKSDQPTADIIDQESNDEGVEADAGADQELDTNLASTVAGSKKSSPKKPSVKRSPSPRKVTKADLEGDSDDEPLTQSEGKKSPRRRTARKAD